MAAKKKQEGQRKTAKRINTKSPDRHSSSDKHLLSKIDPRIAGTVLHAEKKPLQALKSDDAKSSTLPRLSRLWITQAATGSWIKPAESGSTIPPASGGGPISPANGDGPISLANGGGPIRPASMRDFPVGSLGVIEQVSRHARNRLIKEDILTVFAETTDPDAVCKLVMSWKGDAKKLSKNAAICHIPRSHIQRLAAHKSVTYVEAPARLKPTCDKAHEAANLFSPSSHKWTVTQTGLGVLVGIIDTGIDVTHRGFLVNKRSRIVDYLDQTTGAHYQAQADGAIDLVAAAQSRDENGHGTHVAGIAAGNGEGSPNKRYRGVAPDADLAVVKTTFDSPDVAAAIAHIFELASQRRQPCVVNLSLGGHFGAHDGTSVMEQIIDDLCNVPGRVIVASAGNEGQSRIHAMADLLADKDSPVRWVANLEVISRVSNGQIIGATWVQVWTHREDDVSVVLRSPDGYLYSAPFHSRAEYRRDEYLVEAIHQESRHSGDHSTTFSIHTLPLTPWLEGWSLIVEEKKKGGINVGRVHAWIIDETGRFNSGYTRSHLVAIPGTAFSAISVASYATRCEWQSRDTDLPDVELAALKLGDISYFGSCGPTRDEYNKPEVAAPGQYLVSALSKSAETNLPRWLQLPGIPYVAMQGTSMAAPYVTGAIALLLEKEPQLGWADVKRRLMKSVRGDSFTKPVWNPRWGYGKLDVEKLLSIE